MIENPGVIVVIPLIHWTNGFEWPRNFYGFNHVSTFIIHSTNTSQYDTMLS